MFFTDELLMAKRGSYVTSYNLTDSQSRYHLVGGSSPWTRGHSAASSPLATWRPPEGGDRCSRRRAASAEHAATSSRPPSPPSLSHQARLHPRPPEQARQPQGPRERRDPPNLRYHRLPARAPRPPLERATPRRCRTVCHLPSPLISGFTPKPMNTSTR